MHSHKIETLASSKPLVYQCLALTSVTRPHTFLYCNINIASVILSIYQFANILNSIGEIIRIKINVITKMYEGRNRSHRQALTEVLNTLLQLCNTHNSQPLQHPSRHPCPASPQIIIPHLQVNPSRYGGDHLSIVLSSSMAIAWSFGGNGTSIAFTCLRPSI